MTPDAELLTLAAARLCSSAGWADRFKRYEHLLITIGMTEEEAEREVTEAYRAELNTIKEAA